MYAAGKQEQRGDSYGYPHGKIKRSTFVMAIVALGISSARFAA
jgi:hypothetical protein